MKNRNRNSIHDKEKMKTIPSAFLKDENRCLRGHSGFDILLGKNKHIFNHTGNIRFRAIVNHNVKEYTNACRKSKKTALIRLIFANMQKLGFNFLRRDTDGWSILNDVDAREKLSHALRDRVRELRKAAERKRKMTKKLKDVWQDMTAFESTVLGRKNNDSKKPTLLSADSKSDSKFVFEEYERNLAVSISSVSEEGIIERRESEASIASLFDGLANQIADSEIDSKFVSEEYESNLEFSITSMSEEGIIKRRESEASIASLFDDFANQIADSEVDSKFVSKDDESDLAISTTSMSEEGIIKRRESEASIESLFDGLTDQIADLEVENFYWEVDDSFGPAQACMNNITKSVSSTGSKSHSNETQSVVASDTGIPIFSESEKAFNVSQLSNKSHKKAMHQLQLPQQKAPLDLKLSFLKNTRKNQVRKRQSPNIRRASAA